MSTSIPQRRRVSVIGAPIDALNSREALAVIESWAAQRSSRYVCICNAHSVVTASQDDRFMRVLQEADLATPDGAPVAWMIRRQGHPQQQRVSGPDLMLEYCDMAQTTGTSVFLFGSAPATLAALENELVRRYPRLKIAGTLSPPFRPLSEDEDAALVAQINASGAGVVFVSLGCPKQETWMAAHKGRVQSVMIGVGAAFDFHAGAVKRAPEWMQRHGLEWLHRLLSEPRRLWRRYFTTNSLFVWKALRQLIGREPKRWA